MCASIKINIEMFELRFKLWVESIECDLVWGRGWMMQSNQYKEKVNRMNDSYHLIEMNIMPFN